MQTKPKIDDLHNDIRYKLDGHLKSSSLIKPENQVYCSRLMRFWIVRLLTR